MTHPRSYSGTRAGVQAPGSQNPVFSLVKGSLTVIQKRHSWSQASLYDASEED